MLRLRIVATCLLAFTALGLSAAPEAPPDAVPTVAQLRDALAASDAQTRQTAAEQLGQQGPEARAAVPDLIGILADRDVNVRAAAARALGQIGPAAKAAVGPLIGRLKDDGQTPTGTPVLIVASHALAAIGPDALPELMVALQDPDQRVCVGAASAIHQIGPAAKHLVPELLTLLEKDDSRTRIPLIRCLQGIGPDAKAGVPALIKLLDHADFHTQYWTCRALGAIGAEARPAVPALCARTKAGSASVRRNAAAALGRIGPVIGTEGLQTLIAALGDGAEPVRENAVIALGELGAFAAPALPAIREALARRTIAARVQSARALWRITGDPENAVPLLIEQLQTLDQIEAAAALVADIGPAARAAVPALAGRLTDAEEDEKIAICQALGKLGAAAQSAAEPVRALLKDDDPEVRRAAAETLRQIGP